MRLICPNCDAQYEVADDAIPPGGRDVQCSNCGHAWYQMRPEELVDEQEQDALFDPPEADPGPPEDDGAWSHQTDEDVPAPESDGDEADAPAGFEPPEPMRRRAIDDAVLDVLREEAEREVAARRAEGSAPLETQPDLGLEASAAMSPAARRIAQMKGENPDTAPAPPKGAPPKGRDLLPDIEEIKSTLDPADSRVRDDDDDLPQPERSRNVGSGFRTGFTLVVLIALLGMMVYIIAPKLVEQIPALAGPMDGYVAFVDGLRLWLSGVIDKAAETVQGVTG